MGTGATTNSTATAYNPADHTNVTVTANEDFPTAEGNHVADGIAALLRSFDNVDPGGVSPEMLVELAANRLSSIDSDFRGQLNQMNSQADRLSELREATNAISSWASQHQGRPAADTLNGDPGGDCFGGNAMDLDDATVTVTYSNGSTERMSVEEALRRAGVDTHEIQANTNEHGQGHHYIDSSGVGSIQSAISARKDDLGQNSEVQQLQLQQLVSQRSQFLQMMSQVMSSINDTGKAIVGNTGR